MAEQSSLTRAPSDAATCSGAGSGLVRTPPVVAVRAEPIPLGPGASSAQALAVIASSCLRQIVRNQGGVRNGFGEAVHQMRVGLRRLRAAISIFKSIQPKGAFDHLKSELTWLTEQLASAREYDVLAACKREFDEVTRLPSGSATELGDELGYRRQEALAAASRAVTSERFERLIVSSLLGLTLRAGDEAAGERPARELARQVLPRLARRVRRRLRHFGRLGVRERHELRIQVKKLRYAGEFFGALFPELPGRQRRFARTLEALQESLGRLNDISNHQRIAAELVEATQDGRTGRRIAFAMGAFVASEEAELASLVTRVRKQRARLRNAPQFWR